MTLTTPQPTSTDHFTSALAEMREYYRAGSTAPFDLAGSTHAQALLSTSPMLGDDAPDDDVSAQLASIHSQSMAEAHANVGTQKQGAAAASTQAQQDGKANPSAAATAFQAAMDKQRDAAKAASDATIDKAYAAATKLGVANPSSQSTILSSMSTLTTTMNDIIGGITNALSSIIDAIANIISGLLQPLEEVAKDFAPVFELFG
jgi:hypothetical protein